MYREGYVQKGAEGAIKIKFELIGKIGLPEPTLGPASMPLVISLMMLRYKAFNLHSKKGISFMFN